MKQIHMKECDSTQNILRELNVDKDYFVVSTENQIKGVGRKGGKWDYFPGSLAFSFNLTPHKVTTLTSLEIAVLVSKFFSDTQMVALKWPNDLLCEHKKVGGILIEYVSKEVVLVGIGVNLNSHIHQDYKTPAGSLVYVADDSYMKTTPYKLVEFIHKNRLEANEVILEWNKRCTHINKVVTILDGETKVVGTFLGIAEDGAAIIQTSAQKQKVYTGSLVYNEKN